MKKNKAKERKSKGHGADKGLSEKMAFDKPEQRPILK